MSKTLKQIAEQLSTPTTEKKTVPTKTKEVEETKPVPKVQLIYAFNGSGKTRLSQEVKNLIAPKAEQDEQASDAWPKVLYYNAFTEDLFYWDNDLEWDVERKLKIQANHYTRWILEKQGKGQEVVSLFQKFTNDKLTPRFNEEYKTKDKDGKEIVVPAFSEVTFSFERGDDSKVDNIKISKGEESNFIWSIFYTLLEEIISLLTDSEQETGLYDQIKYVFIDDPVTSLDENHLIELAVNLSGLVKSAPDKLKFIITTHSPLFYNVLYNELNKKTCYVLERFEDGTFSLNQMDGDSNKSLSYHLYIKQLLEKAVADNKVEKYHFTLLRNLYEKTCGFLGYKKWADLLPSDEKNKKAYLNRIIQFTSHNTLANEAVANPTPEEKKIVGFLLKHLHEQYSYWPSRRQMMVEQTKPIAESNRFIVLCKYEREWKLGESYQSEADLENELTQDLVNQGYEFVRGLTTPEAMLDNVRVQLQVLNNVEFRNEEWERFVFTYLDKPSDTLTDKTRKIHDDYYHDFVFDDGRIQNIYLLSKSNISRNKVQVIKQFEQTGTQANRYDVTILVNGLPLVQVELKKRGVSIREAFNQIHRYSKESFNSENSLFKYLQIFVISNGTDSRYFANTVKRNKNSFDFTMNWTKADNSLIKDLKDFTATFFQKNTLLNVLLHYSVFDVNDTLLIMRPYQIAATERIMWKVNSSHSAKTWSKPESGGYIRHTTGSGKTLTSFKAARMATDLDFIDKVFFVVDRKDLDYQTMKEYQRFSPDSVNGSDSTAGLKRNLDNDDNKIIVTTIQKLNNLMKSENELGIYDKQVVFIFDECHRSQFGEAQKNLKKKFKRYYQFGFTGTPIFPQNALGAETTASVFGRELHSYVITDAIRDEKVLKFKVDYNDVRPQFKSIETEQDEKKLSAAENKKAFLHPDRIQEISKYILNNFRQKTHRLQGGNKGFNAMFAVSSVDAAKLYYESLNELQKDSDKPLRVATIFSFSANEEQDAIGDIQDESFDVSAMNTSAKEFLSSAINDYNGFFKTNFSVDSNGFQNYYRDLAKRVKSREIDLIIVVGMFLTGFDAPTLNTLFVDKNLRYHGLMQAYSRTNRIYDATKTFGNIVTFRNLEQATNEAITLFGDKNTKNVVLEKSYKEYMDGFSDATTGEARRGFIDVVKELEQRFPNPESIEKESDKKAFAKLFGEYLRVENVLQNYDEFASLKALQNVDTSDPEALTAFKEKHYLSDKDIENLQKIKIPAERKVQDYRSAYNDIRDWLRREKASDEKEKSSLDWEDVVFEVDLLKSQEINLDYILEQIFEHNKRVNDKSALVEDVQRMIRSSLGNRAKEGLLVDFINQTDLDKIGDKASVIDAFFKFAQAEQKREVKELIDSENLDQDAAKRYIKASIKREFASDSGIELNTVLPKMSPLNPEYLSKKQSVFQKISTFVEKFKGVGGQI